MYCLSFRSMYCLFFWSMYCLSYFDYTFGIFPQFLNK
jgi:hypothetical protein